MAQTALRHSRGSIATFFVALALMVLGAAWSMFAQARGAHWVEHTVAVQLELETARSDILFATAQDRSFILTGDRQYADDFERYVASADQRLTRVAEMTRDNPRQVAAIQRLRGMVAARTAIARLAMSRAVILADGATRKRVVEQLDKGPPAGSDLRKQFDAFHAEETTLLTERQAQLRTEQWLTVAALVVLAGILVAAAWHVLQAFADRLAELNAHDAALTAANQRLRDEADRRQEVESQVRQLQKMESLGQLTGGIAHDFNNMLAIVMGSLDMARRRLARGQPAKVEEALDHAMEGAQAAAQLTRRLLAFSRAETLKPQLLDANTFLAGMTELLRRALGENVRVDTELDTAAGRICVDVGQLEAVIVNIAINARDAMPGGGKLCIQSGVKQVEAGDPVLKPGDYVVICLSDSGTGIPPEIMHRVFDPFFTTKGPGKGTGLGLAQVYGFARQSGGTVKMDSEPGKGTRVSLYLPQHSGEAGDTAAPSASMPRAKNSEIILLVEDNEQVREISADQLGELGYTVVSADSAQEALAQLAVQPKVDLLFTDVVMPDVDGRRLSEMVRARRPEVRVLFTSGYAADVELPDGDPMLRKPFTQEELATKVREVLDAKEDGPAALRREDIRL